jgi:hypothetical protein
MKYMYSNRPKVMKYKASRMNYSAKKSKLKTSE